MPRIKNNKWKDVPVQPYTVTDIAGNQLPNPLRINKRQSMRFIPQYSPMMPKDAGNNRKQSNSRGVNPRHQPAQYVPNTIHLEATITKSGKPQKAMISVKDGTYRKILNTRAI